MKWLFLLIPAMLLMLVPSEEGPCSVDPAAGVTSIKLEGVSAEVEVWRDTYGVPHIRAANEKDLFIAFGYVLAADRLFELEASRRVAQGRLSELVGSKWLEMDKQNRDIGFGRVGIDMYPNLDPESREILDNYTLGINLYINSHLDNLPLEFGVLGLKPEPWKATDCLAILRFLCWWLSSDYYTEQTRTYLSNLLGKDKAMSLVPLIFPGAETMIASLLDGDFDGANMPGPDALDAGKNFTNGSNCWAVGPGRTRDGYAILASDPHLELFSPSSWYQVHLTGGDIDAIGVSFPGVPAIPIGHNRDVAWGVSNMPYDVQDLTLLTVDESTNKYLWGDEWVDFEKQEEIIKTGRGADAPTETYTRLLSKGGFVLYRGAVYVALRWTGSEPNDDLTPIINLMRIQKSDDLKTALADFNCSPQSFIGVDTSGGLTQVFAGKLPVRERSDGIISVKGEKTPGWTGTIGTSELPSLSNPPEGYIAHANNLPNYCVGTACGSFKMPYIYRRILDLIQANDAIDVEYMKSMQMDVKNLHAMKYVDYLLKLNDTPEKSPELTMALDLLSNWDFVETEGSSATTLFHEWYDLFCKDLFERVMTPGAYYYYSDYTDYQDMVLAPLLEGKGDPVLFKGFTSEAVRIIARDNLVKAFFWLNDQYGEGPEKWQWSKVHRTVFKHPSGIEFLVGAGECPDRGSRYTIKVADFFVEDNFESTFGVSYRQVIEMRPDDIRGWWILPPGNHGSFVSPHYRDQLPMWLKGEYAPMWYYSNDIETHCALAAMLEP